MTYSANFWQANLHTLHNVSCQSVSYRFISSPLSIGLYGSEGVSEKIFTYLSSFPVLIHWRTYIKSPSSAPHFSNLSITTESLALEVIDIRAYLFAKNLSVGCANSVLLSKSCGLITFDLTIILL